MIQNELRRASPVVALLSTLVAGSVLVEPSGAQEGPQESVRTVRVDATDLLAEVRAAQATFERRRRRLVPVNSLGGGGECDEIVGRLCLRHESGADWWPEEDSEDLRAARERLLDSLAAAAKVAPSDGWVSGQRVLYLLEAGRTREARAAASGCASARPGWCASLRGLALHAEGRYEEAEAEFTRAVRALPDDQRAQWMDLDVILDGSAERFLSDALEASPERFRAAWSLLWMLADPLFLEEGNDRLTEHWARWTRATAQADARNGYGLPWGDDLEELLVRYGHELGWERVPSGPIPGSRESITGHQHPESRTYMPPGDVFEAWSELEPDEWTVAVREPRSGYAPAYAPVVIAADFPVAVFPRGPRFHALARVWMPPDTSRHAEHEHPPIPSDRFREGADVEAGLFVVDRRNGAVRGAEASGQPVTLLLDEEPGAYVVSVEVWDPSRGFAARSRSGLEYRPSPIDVPTLSDLVLMDVVLPDSTTLERAAAHVVRAEVAAGTAIVVGWEVFGLGWRGPEALGYRLSVAPESEGFLARVGTALGLSDGPDRQTLAWAEEGPAEPGPVFRTVSMDLPGLEKGRYRIVLELATKGREVLRSEGVFSVR